MTMEEEQREYDQFCVEFMKKVKEIREDYNNMTIQNQLKFRNAAEEMIVSCGMGEVLNSFRK